MAANRPRRLEGGKVLQSHEDEAEGDEVWEVGMTGLGPGQEEEGEE